MLAVSADGDAAAIRREDGTDESLQIPASPTEMELLQRGNTVRIGCRPVRDLAVIVGIAVGPA